MIYGSVCSGIEAATVAWEPLGWKPSFFSEIDRFPRLLLEHHYPETPLHGDFTTIQRGDYETIDVFVGGTPCQSFSIAGLRGGLSDERGQLSLEYIRLAERLNSRWIVWENVRDVLSSEDGDAFRCFLSGLVRWDVGLPPDGWRNSGIVTANPHDPAAYGVAWRVFDAQYFGVPQRRRRVFVVGYLGDWRRPAAVLFERESLRGHSPPSRETGQEIAVTLGGSSQDGGFRTTDLDNSGAFVPCISDGYGGFKRSEGITDPLRAKGGEAAGGSEVLIPAVAPTLTAGGNETGGTRPPGTNVESATSLIPVLSSGQANAELGLGICPTLSCLHEAPIAFKPSHYTRGKDGAPSPVVPPLSADADKGDQDPVISAGLQVRRLTPRECERLQGFPDDYTLIDWYKCKCGYEFRASLGEYGCANCCGEKPAKLKTSSDSARYKALGNSMAVPVMRWIGERIQLVEEFNQ